MRPKETTVMDHIDQALHPIHIVPKRSGTPLLDEVGNRILAAADGLWYERKTPWMHLRTKIAHQSSVTLPYGDLTKFVSFNFKEFPSDLLEIFERELRGRANQDSMTSCITWSKKNGFEYNDVTQCYVALNDNSYRQVVEDQSRWLVMELQFGSNVKHIPNNLLLQYSGGGYFMGRYQKNVDGEMEKQIDLHVESMVFPIDDVVAQMAEQEFENAA